MNKLLLVCGLMLFIQNVCAEAPVVDLLLKAIKNLEETQWKNVTIESSCFKTKYELNKKYDSPEENVTVSVAPEGLSIRAIFHPAVSRWHNGKSDWYSEKFEIGRIDGVYYHYNSSRKLLRIFSIPEDEYFNDIPRYVGFEAKDILERLYVEAKIFKSKTDFFYEIAQKNLFSVTETMKDKNLVNFVISPNPKKLNGPVIELDIAVNTHDIVRLATYHITSASAHAKKHETVLNFSEWAQYKETRYPSRTICKIFKNGDLVSERNVKIDSIKDLVPLDSLSVPAGTSVLDGVNRVEYIIGQDPESIVQMIKTITTPKESK